MSIRLTPGNSLAARRRPATNCNPRRSNVMHPRQQCCWRPTACVCSAAVRGRRVMVVGLGSVGSRVAEELTEAAFRALSDRSDAAGQLTCRVVSTRPRHGEAKVAALARFAVGNQPASASDGMPNSVDAKSSIASASRCRHATSLSQPTMRVQGMIDSLLFDTAKPGVRCGVSSCEAGDHHRHP